MRAVNPLKTENRFSINRLTARILSPRLHPGHLLLIAFQILILSACGGGTKSQLETPASVAPQSSQQPETLPPSELETYLESIKLIDRQDYTAAEKLLVKLSKKNDSVTGVWANLATAYYHQNKFDKADAAAKRAWQLTPEDAEIQNLMGLLAIKRGEFANAEIHLKKAIALNNELANAHYNLALLHDIYYQDVPTAYKHYNLYLSLIGGNDKETADWVEQLKYSLERE